MSLPKAIVVGAGAFGRNHVRTLAELGALAGVSDPSPDVRERVTSEYPVVPVWASFEEALAAEAPAVVLATPAPVHARMAGQALRAGKDVLVEKPMTLDVGDARDLDALAAARGRVLMVGHLLLFQPGVQWMAERIRSGACGVIRRVVAQRSKLGRVRSAENVWWSFAPHDVSVVLELLGRPRLETVAANGARVIQEQVEDDVSVELGFAGGASASIQVSWLRPEVTRKTIVVGSLEMLVYDEAANTVTIYRSVVNEDLSHTTDESPKIVQLPKVAPLEAECRHFLERVADRGTPLPNGANGVAVVEVLQRAHEELNVCARV